MVTAKAWRHLGVGFDRSRAAGWTSGQAGVFCRPGSVFEGSGGGAQELLYPRSVGFLPFPTRREVALGQPVTVTSSKTQSVEDRNAGVPQVSTHTLKRTVGDRVRVVPSSKAKFPLSLTGRQNGLGAKLSALGSDPGRGTRWCVVGPAHLDAPSCLL